MPVCSLNSSRLSRPSTSTSPAGNLVAWSCSRSYSSLMSPISSSTRSSRVTMPAVPPYSSTTMARWARSRRISDSAESTVLLIGRNFTGRTIRLTGTRSLATPGPGTAQVPDVHEADHVVVGVLVYRQPRMRHPRDNRGGLGDRGFRVQEDHLGARHQDLADLPFARVEDLADDVPFVLADRLGFGHEIAL